VPLYRYHLCVGTALGATPRTPRVSVWLSPHTMGVPGRVPTLMLQLRRRRRGMARIAYARVSSFDQDHATQAVRLKAAGCEIIGKEKASGKTSK
jgi:hypothetical protein